MNTTGPQTEESCCWSKSVGKTGNATRWIFIYRLLPLLPTSKAMAILYDIWMFFENVDFLDIWDHSNSVWSELSLSLPRELDPIDECCINNHPCTFGEISTLLSRIQLP
jgi:hypothetical protein